MADGISRITRIEEDIRLLKLRVDGHTETKTFLVAGDITGSLYVPPFFVGVSPDPAEGLIESKVIYAVRGVVRLGSCTIDWMVNGTVVQAAHAITSSGNNDVILDPAVELHDGDVLRPVIVTADTGSADLAAAVVMTTRWR